MDAVTYPHPDVRAELESWVEGRVDLARDRVSPGIFDVAAVPVAVAVTPDGRVLDRLSGFVEPAEFAAWLATQRKNR